MTFIAIWTAPQARAGSQTHALMAQAAGEVLNELIAQSGQEYRRRNVFLMLGFTLLVVSRVLPAYLP
jgi:hypothetical protein